LRKGAFNLKDLYNGCILVDKCAGYYLYRNLGRYLKEKIVYPLQDIKINDKVLERVPQRDKNIRKFCKRHKAILVTSDWGLHFHVSDVKSILIPYKKDGWNMTTDIKTLIVLQKLDSEYFRLWQIGIDILNGYFDIIDVL